MRYYLQRAYLVLITGSKFFTGPPFSGALLVSEQTRARIQPVFGVPQGLTDYTTRHDWPESWNWMRDQLADRTNVGQSLRWVAALEDIRAYFAVPTLFRKLALTEFSAAAVRTISRCPALQLLAQPQDSLANVSDEDEIASCSIFPFTVIRDGHLSYAQTKTLYHALNQNVSDLFPKNNGQAEIASTPCHIGQPVAIGTGCGEVIGALRISADARLVSECWVRAGELTPTGRLQKNLSRSGTSSKRFACCRHISIGLRALFAPREEGGASRWDTIGPPRLEAQRNKQVHDFLRNRPVRVGVEEGH